jgi:hypothetical protein
MADEAKNKLDTLELLRKSAMERYTWRAQAEWKLCLAIWTALAAFIGAVLTGKGIAPPKTSVWFFVAGAALIFALHWWWLHGLWLAQKLDNDISFFFRDRMMESIKVEFPNNIQNQIENLRRRNRSVWTHWSCTSQLGITALLACGAIAAVWWAVYQADLEKKQSPESRIELKAGQKPPQ